MSKERQCVLAQLPQHQWEMRSVTLLVSQGISPPRLGFQFLRTHDPPQAQNFMVLLDCVRSHMIDNTEELIPGLDFDFAYFGW